MKSRHERRFMLNAKRDWLYTSALKTYYSACCISMMRFRNGQFSCTLFIHNNPDLLYIPAYQFSDSKRFRHIYLFFNSTTSEAGSVFTREACLTDDKLASVSGHDMIECSIGHSIISHSNALLLTIQKCSC